MPAKAVDSDYIEGLRYTGLDAIDWSYQDTLRSKECWMEHKDILSWDRLDETGYNVIIFPKSIGEFNDTVFAHIKEVFKATEFDQDKICFICSLIDKRVDKDAIRFKQLADLMRYDQGYSCLDDPNYYEQWDRPVGIRSLCNDFVYPEDIKMQLNNIISHCLEYKKHDKPCHQACTEANRFPILNSKYMKWQILRFERNQ